jgi:uncharacterized protein YajQ (UPF0234 family)
VSDPLPCAVMAKESSFDVVSQVDLQEVRNAVDQARREISQRFDFKGTDSGIELTQQGAQHVVLVRSNTEQKVKDCVKVLEEKLVKRRVPTKALQKGEIQPAGGGGARQTLGINQGISTDKAREIVRHVKDLKVKAQASVQGEQVRVSSKSKDTLQEVMRDLRERDFGIPVQFTNYR